jgi:hypothetical protein
MDYKIKKQYTEVNSVRGCNIRLRLVYTSDFERVFKVFPSINKSGELRNLLLGGK